MPVTATSLRAVLRAHGDPRHAAGAQRYFVDGVKTYGVHREFLHRFARETAASLQEDGRLAVALRIGDGLFRTGNMDDAALAIRIVERFRRELTPAHFARFDAWVDHLGDWLITLARTGERLPEILGVADRLLGDPDVMVQKGVGWLLKEATKRRADEIVRYLVRNRMKTTRLVLRYACEKLPPRKRQRVLGW